VNIQWLTGRLLASIPNKYLKAIRAVAIDSTADRTFARNQGCKKDQTPSPSIASKPWKNPDPPEPTLPNHRRLPNPPKPSQTRPENAKWPTQSDLNET
jgi:hypothetical protein